MDGVTSVERIQTNRRLLTPREVQILGMAASGQTDKAIACDLRLAHRTVSNRMSLILVKLGAANRTEAVVAALHAGWIRLPTATD